MSRSKTWNPLRGTMWLPQDVSDLHEIDFDPLPEPGEKPVKLALCGAETGANVPEAH